MTQTSIDTTVIEQRAPSCGAMFRDRVEATPNAEAYRYPRGGGWESATWAQTKERVDTIAAGLLALGIKAEERVAIAAGTSFEWVLADLGIICAGAATTTVYPTTIADDVSYILADSGSRVVFAEDDEQIEKLRLHRSDLPNVTKVVTFTGTADGDWVIGLDDLEKLGAQHLADNPTAVDDAIAAVTEASLATLIYTSGTTGKPKGVRLPHRAWTYEGAAIQAQGILEPEDLQFLWLPLAHSFGKVLLTSQLAIGFPTAVDGTVEKIIENVAVIKPTFMGAAPRIFEKAYAKIITKTEAEGGIKAKLFNWAFGVGIKVSRLSRAGKPIPTLLGIQHTIADKIVFSKVREIFGGRIRFFISGAAALNADIAEWFHAAGVLILEGYGLTETSAGTFVNYPHKYKFGTVGPVFPGSEVRLGDDDEVLIKGPGVMDGYHNLPDATSETLDADGWLRTGDKGSIDADGYLTITGRIKDLFKTSGGKYISPGGIESKFKAICPYVSHLQIFGDKRNYSVALVALDPDAMAGWAAENGMAGRDYTEIVRSPEVRDMVDRYMEQLNATLNRWETIKKWEILDHDLTVESGELTPSMKAKRNVVETNYAETIDGMYGD